MSLSSVDSQGSEATTAPPAAANAAAGSVLWPPVDMKKRRPLIGCDTLGAI